MKMIWKIYRRANVPPLMLAYVIALTFAYAITEGAGLGMMLPILQFVESGTNAAEGSASAILGPIGNALSYLNLPVSLPVLIGLALVPLIARQVIFYAKAVTIPKLEYGYLNRLRQRSFDHFLLAGLPFYYDHSQGALTSSLTMECDQASIILRAIFDIIGVACLLVAYAAILLFLSPELTALVFFLLLLPMLLFRGTMREGKNFGHEIGISSQALSETISEVIQGIRQVKIRGLERETIERLKAHSTDLSVGKTALQRLRAGIEAKAQPITTIGTFVVLYIAVQYLDMRLAELGMFMFVAARSSPLLVQFQNSRLTIQSAIKVNQRLDNLCESAERYKDVQSGEIPFPGVERHIEFRDVSFKYGGRDVAEHALADVSFTIGKGQTVALVGPSGAGKSTLVDLIPRFHDPSSGEILIDGTNIRQFELRSFRRKIAFVSQDPSFFHDTVRANIEIGLERHLSDEEIKACLHKSYADEFVSRLPNGVDTVMGERGLKFSGGQRQRLAIARALAQNADILILDEPTSALDTASELEVKASLEKLHGEITTIIIAHRLTTVRHADEIIMLNNGRVAGKGNHDTLMKESEHYRRMVHLQEL